MFFYPRYFLIYFLIIIFPLQLQPCGIVLIRLRQSLTYYLEKYNSPAWGLEKLYLLMEKQRNRGRDGVGIAVIKSNMPPGEHFMQRIRSDGDDAIAEVFKKASQDIIEPIKKEIDDTLLKHTYKFLGDIYLGHLRYGTHSKNGVKYCQPYLYKSNIATKSCALVGNFNMANTKEIFRKLVMKGIDLTSEFDAHIVLNNISYCLDLEYNTMIAHNLYNSDKKFMEASQKINITSVIHDASKEWDGGYVFAGALGNGDSFVCRDPAGIRPCFFYIDEEVVAAASERAALMNVFNVGPDKIQELKPGHLLIIKSNGSLKQEQFIDLLPEKQCTFERIYFSRINDPDIYQERKTLGKNLGQRVLEKIGDDLDNTIFAYIPNSGETALIGLVEEIEKIKSQEFIEKIWEKVKASTCQLSDLSSLKSIHPKVERLVYKDQALRTFITSDNTRVNLVSHIYDITRGIVQPCNTLVVMDDSIVRGTTLRKSIMKQLCSLNPKQIIFVSSAPPIMYPDCYGIDMSQLENLIAFQAAIQLLKEQGKEALLGQIAQRCHDQMNVDPSSMINYLKELYDHFSLEQLEQKIAELVTNDLAYNGKVSIVYQSLDGLHCSLPNHHGDWYFSGTYPTPGGYKVLNTSYLNWYHGHNIRAY